MPFVESSRLERRVGLMQDYDTGAFSVTELCARYGIDRSTFYLWQSRRASGDARWFEDRSHAPGSCPHRTASDIVEAVIAVRERFAHFGPKKIRAWLGSHQPERSWPAASTIGDVLKRAGLVSTRRVRRRSVELPGQPGGADAANQEWACDFKGWFRTGDGRRCDPLTVTDGYSRYLLDIRIADQSIAGVRPVFERLLGDHGLPQAIRCDNGPPFGSDGAGGVGVVGKVGCSPALHPAVVPTGQWSSRAHAPGVEEAHIEAGCGDAGGTAGAVRCVPQPL